jgi:hypothetical protein
LLDTDNKAMTALGPLLSALCLIHCVGFAVLAPLLPGVLAACLKVAWLEPCLWIATTAVTGWTLRGAQFPRRALVRAWFAATALGLVGMMLEIDTMVHLSFAANVAIQAAMVWRRWREHQTSCTRTDCQGCDRQRSHA